MIDSITLKRDKATELVQIMRWKEAMPAVLNDVVGDRFHEHMDEHQKEYLPQPFEMLVGPDYFFQRFELNEGTLVCIISADNGTDEDITLEVIIED